MFFLLIRLTYNLNVGNRFLSGMEENKLVPTCIRGQTKVTDIKQIL